jgi:AhpD family alkylhydroperoxidase
MRKETARPGTLPPHFVGFQQKYPEVFRAYEALGTAAHAAGPLDARTRALVGLAVAVGARHEGAVHAHTRKALAAGVSPEEIRHAVLLAVTTCGFPNMMAALSWVEDLL